MVSDKSYLFREKSLERLSSPERLDELMQLVSPRARLLLIGLGLLVGSGLVWSIWGRIPVTVAGRGVLVHPHRLVSLQSPVSGALLQVNIRAGDSVRKGDVIALLNQAELQKRLAQEQSKLRELQRQAQTLSSVQTQRTTLELQEIRSKRKNLQRDIAHLEALIPVWRDKGEKLLQQQRQNLQKRLREARYMVPKLQQQWQAQEQLVKEGAISQNSVLDAEQRYLESLARADDLENQLEELEVRQAENKQTYLNNVRQLADLRTQLQILDTREKSLSQQTVEAEIDRRNQIEEVKRTINQLQLQLQTQGEIRAEYSGRVTELTVAPGQVLSPGMRIGTIEVVDPDSTLLSINYFSVADGKKLAPGMRVLVTPETVKRAEFGGIVGQVTAISPFPVTQEAALNMLGNSELAKSLVAQEPKLEVETQLNYDPTNVSSYQWSSSQGPPLLLSAGTTANVRVTVEERAPITFLLPMWREVSGIY